MKKILSIFIIISFFISPLPAVSKHISKLSQLELRDIQTRYFDTGNTELVMKAAINTLQDSGYTIQEIDPELGYMRARKYYKGRHTDKKRLAGWSALLALTATYTVFSYGTAAGTMIDPTRRIANELKDKTVVVDTNVNIEKFGKNRTKVRFVAVQKVLLNADGYSFVKSAPMKVMRVYDPAVYQEFFSQIDKSIFYEGI